MSSEKENILGFHQYMKSHKMPYIVSANMELLIEKIDKCANNLENFSTRKIEEHIPCGNSISTIWEFNNTENDGALYCGEDCMNKSCSSLREHAKNIIDFAKEKMLPLTKEGL